MTAHDELPVAYPSTSGGWSAYDLVEEPLSDRWQAGLSLARLTLAGGVGLCAGVVALAWVLPGAAVLLPAGWALLPPDAALALVCASLSLLAMDDAHSPDPLLRSVRVGALTLCAGLALPVLLSALVPGLAALTASLGPGAMGVSMDVPFARFFAIAGLAAATVHAMHPTWRRLADLFTVLVAGSTYSLLICALFGADAILPEQHPVVEPLGVLLAMSALALALVLERVRRGALRVVTQAGVAGRIALELGLISLVIPPAAIWVGLRVVELDLVPMRDVAALVASAVALSLLVVVTLLAVRVAALENRLRDVAISDPLTGLLNRRGLEMMGAMRLNDSARNGSSVWVLYLDLDGLKAINDDLGHHMGSLLIKEFSAVLRSHSRKTDLVARVGGDEFVLMGPGTATGAATLGVRLRGAALHRSGVVGMPMQFSMGVASCVPSPKGGTLDTLADLVAQADAAMYEDKRRRQERAAMRQQEQATEAEPLGGVALSRSR